MKRVLEIDATVSTPKGMPVLGAGATHTYVIEEEGKEEFVEYAKSALPVMLFLVGQAMGDPELMDLLLNTADAYIKESGKADKEAVTTH